MTLSNNFDLVVVGMYIVSIALFAISFGTLPSGAELTSTTGTIKDSANSILIAISGMTLFVSATLLFRNTSFVGERISTSSSTG